MQLQCPHCHNPIQVLVEGPAEIVCPSCGSSFRSCADPIKTTENAIRTLGRFQLMERLGIGAFGAVYRARDSELDRIVAVKVAHPSYLESPQEKERFIREARAAAQLRHPGIVPVHEVLELDGTPAIVSDYVDGLTLRDLLEMRRLTFRESAEVVAAVSDALNYAHSLGIVHRDIKPANIMVEFPKGQGLAVSLDGLSAASDIRDSTPNVRPLVLDFGLALRDQAEVTMTIDGQILGTPAYMSPEQAAGQSHSVDRRCDVYSLGVVLYELLAGELPFRGSKVMMVQQVLRDEPRPPRRVNDKVPRDLETICLKAMSKQPAARYASAGDLASDLRRYLRSEPILARPTGPLERCGRWCGRNKTVAALIALVALACTAGTVASTVFAAKANARARSEADARSNAEELRKRAETLAEAERQARVNESAARKEAVHAADQERAARAVADQASQQAFRSYYMAQMQLAQADWNAARVGPLRDRLRRTMPEFTGQIDLRGFEWFYWRRLCDVSEPKRFQGYSPIIYFHDGWRVASGQRNSSVVVRDYQTGKTLRVLGAPTAGQSRLAVSPDGRRLAAANGRNQVSVWETDSGRLLSSFDAHPAASTAVAGGASTINHLEFNREGDRLATCGREGAIKLWSLKGESLKVMRGAKGAAVCVRFTPQGLLLSSGFSDRTLQFWDTETGEVVRSIAHDPQGAMQFALSPDGERVVASYLNRTVKVWSVETGKELLVLRHQSDVNEVVFSPDGKQIATGSTDRVVRLWDSSTGELVQMLKGHEGMIGTIAYGPDGRQVGSTAGREHALVFATNDHQEFQALPGHPASVIHTVFDATGKRLASGGLDHLIHIWDMDTGQIEAVLRGHRLYVDRLSFSSDGEHLASAGRDRTARLWDLATGEEILTVSSPSSKEFVHSVDLSPDGKNLLVAVGNAVEVRNAQTGDLQQTFQGSGSQLYGALYSRDGRKIAALNSNRVLQVWNAETKVLTAELQGARYSQFAFSPDGLRIAAAGDENTVIIWDLASQKVHKTLRGHGAEVRCVAFHPKGDRLASGGFDMTVKIWDVDSGEELLLLPGARTWVDSLAFAPEGLQLAAAGDPVIRLFDGHPMTPEATIHRDAWLLVDFFRRKQLSPAEIQNQIESDVISEPVRKRAAQLIGPESPSASSL